MTIQIDAEKCVGCGDCVDHCQAGALEMGEDPDSGRVVAQAVEERICSECGTCVRFCLEGAIS